MWCTGNSVLFAHRDNSAIDHMPINDLLGLADVTQVNFDNDKRVLTVWMSNGAHTCAMKSDQVKQMTPFTVYHGEEHITANLPQSDILSQGFACTAMKKCCFSLFYFILWHTWVPKCMLCFMPESFDLTHAIGSGVHMSMCRLFACCEFTHVNAVKHLCETSYQYFCDGYSKFLLRSQNIQYCKTLYFSCILIWRIWSLEISLHFNLAFCHGLLWKVKF